jgi:hypothetical protein
MNRRHARLLILAILPFAGLSVAHAEGGCPDGFYPLNTPGVAGCAPIPGYGEATEDAPPPAAARWEDRWGATVVGNNGGFGAAVDMKSQRAAERAARAQCLKTNDGKGCDNVSTYANQCVAVAAGQSIATTEMSRSPEDAQRSALQSCTRQDGGCKVVYAACSQAQLVR